MARVTAEQVSVIMDDSVEIDKIEPFIPMASSLTDKLIGSYTDDELITIETWLTAHLLTATIYRQTTSESILGSTVKYGQELGSGLLSTTYGQQLALFDYNGLLAESMKRKIILESL